MASQNRHSIGLIHKVFHADTTGIFQLGTLQAFGHLAHMAFGIFIHRSDSIYDDVQSEWYQFPKQYLSRAKQCEGDWIVYLEPMECPHCPASLAEKRV